MVRIVTGGPITKSTNLTYPSAIIHQPARSTNWIMNWIIDGFDKQSYHYNLPAILGENRIRILS